MTCGPPRKKYRMYILLHSIGPPESMYNIRWTFLAVRRLVGATKNFFPRVYDSTIQCIRLTILNADVDTY